MRKLGLLSLAALFALGSPAAAYVRTTTSPNGSKRGVPVRWPVGCVVVTPDSRGSQDVSLADIEGALGRAADNWNRRTSSCADMVLSTQPARRALDVTPDGIPALVFRDKVWGLPGGMMHDPSAIGLTTVFYVDTPGRLGDGTILDADIELNGVGYTFTVTPATATARPGTLMIADLENTLTHELGHVQGLAHNCWDHTIPAPPLDDQGNPAPDCNAPDLPPSITGATMFPYQLTAGETSKRNLSADDLKGICDIYPNSGPTPACFNNLQAGWLAGDCSFGGDASLPRGTALLALLMLCGRVRWRA